MLALTRKVGEEVRIGETIVVKVLGVRGTTVQLGIEAPKDVKILRPELAGQASPPRK